MKQSYNVKIQTAHKSYTFKWTLVVKSLMDDKYPSDAFFMHDTICVNEDGKGDKFVPRHAILEVQLTPIKDMY